MHLARAVAKLPVMIVANHRDERGSGADLRELALYELSRLPNAEHIKLLGLPDHESLLSFRRFVKRYPRDRWSKQFRQRPRAIPSSFGSCTSICLGKRSCSVQTAIFAKT